MELSTEMLELIDRYLEKELNETERIDFEARLVNNKSLQKLVGEQQLIKVGIEQSAEAALKKKLNGIHESLSFDVSEDLEKPDKIVEMQSSGYRKWLAIAASFLLLITIGFFSMDYLTKEDVIADNNTDDEGGDLLATPRNLKATKNIKHIVIKETNDVPTHTIEDEGITLRIYSKQDNTNTYSFSENDLLIFDSSIELTGNEQFQVWEIEGMDMDGFYLSIDDTYYLINSNEEKQQLKTITNKTLEEIIKSN